MKASFSLIPRIINPTINAGETVEIEIYISGYGEIKKSKLVILYNSQLVNKKNAGVIECHEKPEPSQQNNKFVLSKKVQTTNLDNTGITIGVGGQYFTPTGEVLDSTSPFYPMTYGEMNQDNLAPFRMRINTARKDISGDYVIDMTLTYSDGNELSTDHEAVTIHVRDFRERYEKRLTILTIVLGASSLVFIQPVLTDLGMRFLDYIKHTFG